MKNLQKVGGVAALIMAVSHLVGIDIFLVELDYPSLTSPAQRVALNVEKQALIFSTNLMMYVLFGVLLVVLLLALYDRLKSGAPAMMQAATAIGFIWAGSLIASGMVANAGLAAVVPIYVENPTQAALTWQGIEAVTNGLGNANGEILGGLLTLLVSIAALRTGQQTKIMNIFGLAVGAVGIISVIPGLTDLTGVFGVGQMVWFIRLGLLFLRSKG